MAENKLRRSPSVSGDGDVDLDRDRVLVRRCQDGDGAAFAELYTQYHDRLHRFCTRRLLDRDEADEVTQEAFLRAWRALPTFSGEMRFYPWLTVIAKNLCTDALRRRARYGTVEDFDRQPPHRATRVDATTMALSSEEAVMAAFDGELAAQALTRLSDRHRNVLALREEAGLSYQEIARAQGVEISTVETLLWRARQALKREYAQLAGVRVLGGILIAGGALRRMLDRAMRRTVRIADVLSKVNGKGLAAAGVVTVALAGVAVTQGTSGAPAPSAPTGVVAPAGAASSATGTTSASVPQRSSRGTTPSTPPPISSAAGSGSSSPGSGSGSLTPTPGSAGGAGGVGSGAQSVVQAASQLPPQLASEVPSILNAVTSNLSQATADLNQAAAGATSALPLPSTPPVTIPPSLNGTVGGLTSGLGGH